MRLATALTESPLDEAALYRDFVAGLDAGSGAVVSFTGRMRNSDPDGEPLHRLVLEHHPERSAESIHEAAAAVAARHPLDLLQVVHRCGAVQPGEAIVWVAAAAAHRRAAFTAVDEVMDRLKTEAILWKREEGPSGAHWIDPLPTDHADRARWEEH